MSDIGDSLAMDLIKFLLRERKKAGTLSEKLNRLGAHDDEALRSSAIEYGRGVMCMQVELWLMERGIRMSQSLKKKYLREFNDDQKTSTAISRADTTDPNDSGAQE